MTTVASIVALGFLLGMRHATDVDHVVAVATIVSRERRVKLAAWVGALWGLGHTVTIVVVGTPIILFNWVVAPRVGLAMEFAVGVMLMLLGLRNLTWRQTSTPGREGAEVVHAQVHAHGDYVHSHPHGHGPESHRHAAGDTPLGRLDRAFGGLDFYQAVRPIVVGIVHGLAGSAAVALVVLTTIRDPTWAVAYLLVFGTGTVAGMVLITTALAIPFAGPASRSVSTHRRLRVATGLLSFGFGVFLAYRIGVVNGLFSVAPRWTPQ
jgi:hypothetical protein